MIMGLTNELRVHFGAPSDRGVLVARVEQGSAAAKAGVKVGDVIVAVGSQQTAGADAVIAAIRTHQPGDRVAVTIERDGVRKTVTVTLIDAANAQG
jgi:serine protease Do